MKLGSAGEGFFVHETAVRLHLNFYIKNI